MQLGRVAIFALTNLCAINVALVSASGSAPLVFEQGRITNPALVSVDELSVGWVVVANKLLRVPPKPKPLIDRGDKSSGELWNLMKRLAIPLFPTPGMGTPPGTPTSPDKGGNRYSEQLLDVEIKDDILRLFSGRNRCAQDTNCLDELFRKHSGVLNEISEEKGSSLKSSLEILITYNDRVSVLEDKINFLIALPAKKRSSAIVTEKEMEKSFRKSISEGGVVMISNIGLGEESIQLKPEEEIHARIRVGSNLRIISAYSGNVGFIRTGNGKEVESLTRLHGGSANEFFKLGSRQNLGVALVRARIIRVVNILLSAFERKGISKSDLELAVGNFESSLSVAETRAVTIRTERISDLRRLIQRLRSEDE